MCRLQTAKQVGEFIPRERLWPATQSGQTITDDNDCADRRVPAPGSTDVRPDYSRVDEMGVPWAACPPLHRGTGDPTRADKLPMALPSTRPSRPASGLGDVAPCCDYNRSCPVMIIIRFLDLIHFAETIAAARSMTAANPMSTHEWALGRWHSVGLPYYAPAASAVPLTCDSH